MSLIISKKELFPLLKKILPFNPIILEAGAFDGKDTIRMSDQWPKAIIHAFEPVPEIYALLQKNTENYSNINCYKYALDIKCGFASFYKAKNPKKPGLVCQAGSLLKPKERLLHSPIIYPEKIQVETITLNYFIESQNIPYIDLLWLDLQGNELSALQSMQSHLSQVQYIYTEVNFIEAYECQGNYQEIEKLLKKYAFEPIAQDFKNTDSWFFGNVLYARSSSANPSTSSG
jgi:FkbM family methyltransferase